MRYRTFSFALLVFITVLLPLQLRGDGGQDFRDKPMSADGQQLLNSLLGATNEARMAVAGAKIAPSDVLSAMYGKDRALRLVALGVVAHMPSPLELVPYLVAFLQASERQSASGAADALLQVLSRIGDPKRMPPIAVEGQAAQLIESLLQVASNGDVELDMRVVSLQAVDLFGRMGGRTYPLPVSLMEDESPVIRAYIPGSLDLPLGDDLVGKVAQLASDDPSEVVRGQAVAVLCENALTHGVSGLSSDLNNLIKNHISGTENSEMIAPVLGCLSHFPYAARADLSDVIAAKEDKTLKDYWKKLLED